MFLKEKLKKSCTSSSIKPITFIISSKNYVKAYFRMYLGKNLSLGMFLRCSYFFTISEADVLINSVLRQNTACIYNNNQNHKTINDSLVAF